MGGSVPGGYSGSFSSEEASVSSPLRNDIEPLAIDCTRGRRFIHDGPSSLAWVYDKVIVNVLMRLPKVNTAIDEPCTRIDEITRKVVIGQISRTM